MVLCSNPKMARSRHVLDLNSHLPPKVRSSRSARRSFYCRVLQFPCLKSNVWRRTAVECAGGGEAFIQGPLSEEGWDGCKRSGIRDGDRIRDGGLTRHDGVPHAAVRNPLTINTETASLSPLQHIVRHHVDNERVRRAALI